ncbi:MAG: NAD(P)-dependent oxidoreductase [Granulosicoccus sp.]|nr:NAD(P)-dependent oxidoreductase [Granulosicoccus sp.]
MTQTIGFIGLGVLGSAIIKNLVAAGFKVIGCDIAEPARQKALQLGISVVSMPDELITQTDVVFTCLPHAAALHEVLHGKHGILSIEIKDQIIIDLSTLSIADKTSFEKACLSSGRLPVDCPVSGNRIMALNKKLTAFFSGQEQLFDQCKPILDCTCSEAHYVGAFGNGTKVKLCGNILNLVHNTVAAEAMVLAMKSGLDPSMFHKVISGSGSSSAMFEVRGGLMVDEDYQRESMNLSVPLKDARIISEHAASLHCPIPLYQTALQSYHAAAAQGLMDQDAAVVCKVMERAANHTRSST